MMISKTILAIFVLLLFNACSASNLNSDYKKKTNTNPVTKKQFSSLWNQLKSDPYTELPNDKVTYDSLSIGDQNIILENAKRTLKTKDDILNPFLKLAHPNGICFKGTWEINAQNIYSGYFKKGTKALIIARASEAFGNSKNNTTRALGFAGKIFPTINENEINQQDSANFFLIDDLGGTSEKFYTNTTLTNAPKVSLSMEVFKNLFYALKVKKEFTKADKNPEVRQLYPISSMKEASTNIRTPKYMKIKAISNLNIKEEDYRNELKIKGNNLIFEIFVASGEKKWNKIGLIILSKSISSYSCDHRLHFTHPILKEEKY